ncbi:MAG: transglutaminase family protein [Deltaproteobacteria bacterium]|nr:transglutaminase family protein [Deltaproteobacteria bacterium]
MIFEISHTMTYNYSGLVALNPHELRLRPRSDGTQRIRQIALNIDPLPAGMAEGRDAEGNDVVSVWFADATRRLQIASRLTVETVRDNPFDFIITDPAAAMLPVSYATEIRPTLESYRIVSEHDASLYQFARSIAADVKQEPLAFLAQLNTRIHERTTYVTREHGDPQSAAATLAQKRGACRDLAVLFIESCRVVGLAARFVSGYTGGKSVFAASMHAWAEVYLPGGGWRGYDPTSGLTVADQHVVIAAGRIPRLAAPVTGSFRGAGVFSSLQVALQVQCRPAEAQPSTA